MYSRFSQFHVLFMQPPWEQLRPTTRTVVGSCAQSVVVEVGADSGVGARVIAEECRAEIFTLEPHPMMRAMLLARVGAAPTWPRG